MNEEDQPGSSAAKGDKPCLSWLEKIGQFLYRGEPRSGEQLLEMMRDASQRELLDGDALAMIEGVLQVAEMQVRDIMIPRSQMVVVEHDADPRSYLPVIIKSAHSRFPVIGESRDEIIGILLAKDLLAYLAQGDDAAFDIREALRPVIFIPESKRLNVLLKEFRANRNHMAVVVDEYGGVAGLVTIEDVLEQIVGEIEDEHDIDDDSHITQYGSNRHTIKSLTPIEEFNEYFGSHFRDDEFDTIGGLVMHGFGHMPKRGEMVTLEQYQFKVLRADNRRIHLLQLLKIDSAVQQEEETMPGDH